MCTYTTTSSHDTFFDVVVGRRHKGNQETITMNPFNELSDDNRDQLFRYLQFFRAKKDSAVRSLGHEFQDAKSDRLNDDMFSQEDMADFADVLESQTKVFFIRMFIFQHSPH